MSERNGNANGDRSVANRISLAQMQPGQRGKIVAIGGGYHLARRLDALGIRVGKEVTKVSAQLLRGPVLLRQDNTQVAVGFGMASRVLVELNLGHK